METRLRQPAKVPRTATRTPRTTVAALVEGTDATENGHAAEKGNDTPDRTIVQRVGRPLSMGCIASGRDGWQGSPPRRMATQLPSRRTGAVRSSRCFAGRIPTRSSAGAWPRRSRPWRVATSSFTLFSRQPFGLEFPGPARVTPSATARACDLLEQVQEFTSRAATPFCTQFPGGSPHVTLMGYEWSGAGPLGLLRGLKNNRTIFSVHSLERQRSDMTSEISKRIDELEQTTLREAQVVLSQQPAASDAARFWVPECAGQLVVARQPFPPSSLKPSSMPARSRPAIRSARSIRRSCSSAT